MAKVTITIEDVGSKTLALNSEIVGEEQPEHAASPAMLVAMAIRAMFENGMLAEAAEVALAGIEKGKLPSEAILTHYQKAE